MIPTDVWVTPRKPEPTIARWAADARGSLV